LNYTTSKSIVLSSEDLWVLPMQGEPKPQPFLTTPFDEGFARFSPDGRWVAYHSDESGRYEVYVREFVTQSGAPGAGGKWMVSKDGGRAPYWRNDGKELVYVNVPTGQVMSVSVEPGATFKAGVPRELFRVPPNRNGYAPLPDLSRFLFATAVEPKGPQAFNVMINWTSLLKRH
jgi:eukaryotic-like serine/threonine-protein kinase